MPYKKDMSDATKEDLHEFQRLAYEGRVYEIINWVNTGRPIRFVNGRYKKPLSGLRIAIEAGGHSLLKVLLELGNWTATELNEAAATATKVNRSYLVELLFDHGAKADQCCVFDFFQMMDVELAERAILLGLDPTQSDEFAQVLSYTGAARPLLRFYKQNAKKIKGLEDQLGIALLECIAEKRFHACVMLMWAGANPHTEYPWQPRGHFPGYGSPEVANYDFDEDTRITAFNRLASLGDYEFYEKLKLKPNELDKLSMLEWISGDDHERFAECIIEQCNTALLNSGSNRRCEVFEQYLCYGFSRHKKASTVKAFLDKGATLKPGKDAIRRMRKSILEGGQYFTIGTIGLLIEYNQAPELIWELGRTPKMQEYLAHTNDWKQFKQGYLKKMKHS